MSLQIDCAAFRYRVHDLFLRALHSRDFGTGACGEQLNRVLTLKAANRHDGLLAR